MTGAGYYYRPYTAHQFNVSSLLQKITPQELKAAGVRATMKPSLLIENFKGDWEKEWFTYRPEEWARSTHKVYDDTWQAPPDAKLALQVRAAEANCLVVLIDDHAAEVELVGGAPWQEVVLAPGDFQNAAGQTLASWEGIKQVKLSPTEQLKTLKGTPDQARKVGRAWQGPPPEFRDLRWTRLGGSQPAAGGGR